MVDFFLIFHHDRPENEIGCVKTCPYLTSIYTEEKTTRNIQNNDGCCPNCGIISFYSYYSM
jgi:hypothetical protein